MYDANVLRTIFLEFENEDWEAELADFKSTDVDVRSFECLGACDIAPMASVNGEYVGPLDIEDAGRIVEDLAKGRPVLEHKQLRTSQTKDGVARTPHPEFRVGDTIRVGVLIKEGEKVKVHTETREFAGRA